MLKLVAGASLVTLVGCATTEETPSGVPPGGPPQGKGNGSNREVSEGEIPEETAGPYPGDGSNGANVLTESGVVRSDITSSFGSSTTTAEWVPLAITMTLQNFDADSAPYAGAAIYLWHCDRDGQYSLYSEAVQNENYLRGVQEADAQGQVSFTTIYPPATPGGGRTSTSRSTRPWPRPQAARTRSPPRSWPCPRRPIRRCTRPAGTRPACRTPAG